MKFTIHMKTPDAVEYGAESAATSWNEDDEQVIDTELAEELQDAARKWFKYGETCSIEIDTEAGTATVLEAK